MDNLNFKLSATAESNPEFQAQAMALAVEFLSDNIQMINGLAWTYTGHIHSGVELDEFTAKRLDRDFALTMMTAEVRTPKFEGDKWSATTHETNLYIAGVIWGMVRSFYLTLLKRPGTIFVVTVSDVPTDEVEYVSVAVGDDINPNTLVSYITLSNEYHVAT